MEILVTLIIFFTISDRVEPETSSQNVRMADIPGNLSTFDYSCFYVLLRAEIYDSV